MTVPHANIVTKCAGIIGWLWLGGCVIFILWLMIYSARSQFISPRIFFALAIPPVWLICWAKQYRTNQLTSSEKQAAPRPQSSQQTTIAVQKLAAAVSSTQSGHQVRLQSFPEIKLEHGLTIPPQHHADKK